MIENLRAIKERIKGIEGMRKITQAMEMVSAVKLSRVKNILYRLRPYCARLESMTRDLLASYSVVTHPMLEKRAEIRKVTLCVVTSDAGLCGSYNHNIIKVAEEFIEKIGSDRIALVTIGKEGAVHFKKRACLVASPYPESRGRYLPEMPGKIASDLVAMFLSGRADEVYVAYTRFDSTLRHRPVVEKFLNLEDEKKTSAIFITEPDVSGVLDKLLLRYLSEKMRLVILNSFVSEHSARMISMKAATDNADEMIDALTLARNKARQYAITKEVLEIAAAAEALKG